MTVPWRSVKRRWTHSTGWGVRLERVRLLRLSKPQSTVWRAAGKAQGLPQGSSTVRHRGGRGSRDRDSAPRRLHTSRGQGRESRAVSSSMVRAEGRQRSQAAPQGRKKPA